MLLSLYLNKPSFEKWKDSYLWDLISQVENSSTLLSAIARVEMRALSRPFPLVLLKMPCAAAADEFYILSDASLTPGTNLVFTQSESHSVIS